jgi:aromatic ring-opening dioxygenase catalytic subunit (LigB family)
MPIVYACAASHAPGITAWTEAAPKEQAGAVESGFATLRRGLEAARPDTILVLTSEHWVNFFLDHASAFCLGRGEGFTGPVEPWLRIERRSVPGNPNLATRLLEHCYANDFEISHSQELAFDHGTMVPLSFVNPGLDMKVVPLFFNTLATPRPTARRCLALGRTLRSALDAAPERIALLATGGLSHDPGEVNHGVVDSEFDRVFLDRMSGADLGSLAGYSDAELLAAGAGTLELLAWICLAGIMGCDQKPDVVIYEAVKPWATGIGMMTWQKAAA